MMQFGASESDAGVGGLAVRLTSEDFGRPSSIFEKRLQETLDTGGIQEPTPSQWFPKRVSPGSTGKGLNCTEASRMSYCRNEHSYRGPW